AIGAMTLTGSNFTLFALLGLTLLVGLVGKNAVLLVDYTDSLRKQGSGRTDALLQAGPVRLRPILMTSLSVIASLAPVASGIEAGSELLQAAAIVLIGGLLTSTVLDAGVRAGYVHRSSTTVNWGSCGWCGGLARRGSSHQSKSPSCTPWIAAKRGSTRNTWIRSRWP